VSTPLPVPGLAVTQARAKGEVPHDEETEHDVLRDSTMRAKVVSSSRVTTRR
jgi:hypothetical protein